MDDFKTALQQQSAAQETLWVLVGALIQSHPDPAALHKALVHFAQSASPAALQELRPYTDIVARRCGG